MRLHNGLAEDKERQKETDGITKGQGVPSKGIRLSVSTFAVILSILHTAVAPLTTTLELEKEIRIKLKKEALRKQSRFCPTSPPTSGNGDCLALLLGVSLGGHSLT